MSNTLLVLHGANMTGKEMANYIGPTPGFTTYFPDAKRDKRWDHIGNADFPALSAINADYVAGISSGGFMAMRLVRERKYKGAIICAAGVISYYLMQDWDPCPIMLVHGTADKRVPYDGVPYAYEAGMDAALGLKALMGIKTESKPIIINPKADGCRTVVDNWGPLRLWTVVNGGHTWPGAAGAPLLGPTTSDWALTPEMLKFCQEFP